MDNNNFNKRRNILVVAVLGVVLLGFISYVIYKDSRGPQEETQRSDFATVLSVPEPRVQDEERFSVPEGWRAYQNTRFGFILAHPSEVEVREVDEGGGSITIIFEDTKNAQGFQMFVVPYAGTSISEERFNKDVPSGVRDNVEKIFLNGVEGVAFDSRDAFLGETKEVWFIDSGFLYEATAPKILDGWFAEILATWKFQ